MPILHRIRRHLLGDTAPQVPIAAPGAQLSAIASAHADPGQPDDVLIDLALRAAARARTIDMSGVCARMAAPPHWPAIWPGEHYKLLGALIEEIRPGVVVEIGTFQGLSALAMRRHLPAGARLHTFDIVPWREIDGVALRDEDFADGVLVQELGDLADASVLRRHAPLLQSAEFIFVDGPKNVVFERALIAGLDRIGLPLRPIVMFDDIRLWNMLAIWQELAHPKLDLTSFGHWSGTGLVHWT